MLVSWRKEAVAHEQTEHERVHVTEDDRGGVRSGFLHQWWSLQWVHGRITAVMTRSARSSRTSALLQWVRGPITAVMGLVDTDLPGLLGASMGQLQPRWFISFEMWIIP